MPDSSSAMPRQFHVTSADGTDIGCHVFGDGPPLLMVHGVAIDHSCFDRARPGLSEQFTLYVMDRRGRGISGDAPDWSLEKEFEDVRITIEALAAETGGPINLFGHSLGGLCTVEAASRAAPDTIRRFFMYDPAIPKPPRSPALIAIADKLAGILKETGDREKMIETHLLEWTKISPEVLARQKADTARWARRLGWAHTIPREYKGGEVFVPDHALYKNVKVPTRIMVGEQSHQGLQDSAKVLADTISGADLIVFKGAGHYGFTSDPQTFVAEMVKFFIEER
jgi:pimeloyl-ACP methyl ester carboxylesterase